MFGDPVGGYAEDLGWCLRSDGCRLSDSLYAGYDHLDKIKHAWCGIHLVPDLRAVHDSDPEGQSWAEVMVTTLLLANDTAHAARAEGHQALTDTELATIRSRYAGAIARGWDENATGPDPPHEQARTLLRRFQRHRDMILRFTVDLDVPFTNYAEDRVMPMSA